MDVTQLMGFEWGSFARKDNLVQRKALLLMFDHSRLINSVLSVWFCVTNCRKIRILTDYYFIMFIIQMECLSSKYLKCICESSCNIYETLLWPCKQELDEVDECVQVETLKFEQDSAVQVDTLPPLTKLTSRDAYLYELETAIQECAANLDSLEDALSSPAPQEVSTGHSSSPHMVRICSFC